MDGTVCNARLLEENILALDITTAKPFVYVPGQDALLTATIDGQQVQRRFSLAGSMDGESATLARFLIRHNPDGQFTDWLFTRQRDGQLVGSYIQLTVVPIPG